MAVSRIENVVSRLALSIASMANLEMGAADPPPIKSEQFLVNACLSDKCSKANMDQSLNFISNDEPHLDIDVASGALRLAVFLQQLDGAISSVLEAPKELDLEKKPDKVEALKEIMTSGITQCFFDPEKARNLSETMVTLRLISFNASFIRFRIGDPKIFLDMTTKFPQTGSNSKWAVLELQSAAERLMLGKGGGTLTRRIYTFEDFIAALARGYRASVAGLQEFDEQCNTTLSVCPESS